MGTSGRSSRQSRNDWQFFLKACSAFTCAATLAAFSCSSSRSVIRVLFSLPSSRARIVSSLIAFSTDATFCSSVVTCRTRTQPTSGSTVLAHSLTLRLRQSQQTGDKQLYLLQLWDCPGKMQRQEKSTAACVACCILSLPNSLTSTFSSSSSATL